MPRSLRLFYLVLRLESDGVPVIKAIVLGRVGGLGERGGGGVTMYGCMLAGSLGTLSTDVHEDGRHLDWLALAGWLSVIFGSPRWPKPASQLDRCLDTGPTLSLSPVEERCAFVAPRCRVASSCQQYT